MTKRYASDLEEVANSIIELPTDHKINPHLKTSDTS